MKKYISILSTVLAVIMLLPSCSGNTTPELTTEESTAVAGESTAAETEKMIKDINIFTESGESRFIVVRGENATTGEIEAAMNIRNAIKKIDPKVKLITDWAMNPDRQDYEIVVGETEREESCSYDPERALLGSNGYVIRVVGTRIFVTGSTSEATLKAAEAFVKMIDEAGSSFSLKEDFEMVGNSASSLFSSVTLNGKSLAGYSLSFDGTNTVASSAAAEIRGLMLEKTGVVLKLDSEAKETENVIKLVGTSTGSSTAVKAGDGFISVESNDKIGYYRVVRDWFESLGDAGDGKVLELKTGTVYTKDYGNFITYEDFGAKGDAYTDDTAAIKATHKAANETGTLVLTREGATYYIGKAVNIISIRTDVDWGISKIIIDDTNVEKCSEEVFRVSPENSTINLDIKKLSAGQKKIDVQLDGKYIVTVKNDNIKQYIRYGSNQNSGSAMIDIIIVDRNGNISEDTPVLWDFDTVTSCVARKIDEKEITIKGGRFVTIANNGTGTAYYYRGIRIYRSNVTFDGLYHTVEGEAKYGQPYYGILIFNTVTNCTVKNCTFTGHKTFYKIGNAGTKVSMGTYDITTTNSVNFTAINCRQTNDINNSTYWGVFASNYCKNILFDGCVFSRFDAHCGVCNVTLRNCSFGHQGVNLIGHGEALIDNCTIMGTYLVNLRSDYGSTWNGNLTIKNSTYIPKNGAKANPVIINGSNPGSHNFGYTCYLPQNILIDGLYINDSNYSDKSTPPYLFAQMNSNYNSASYVAAYPMVMPKSITVKNLTTASGRSLSVSANKYMFAGVTIN